MTKSPIDTTFDSKSHKRMANYISKAKSFKRLKTPACAPINEPVEASSKAHLIYRKMCADVALDYYNKKNDTRFELVEDETLDSCPFIDSYGSWIHCSFNAKEDFSPKKFFAELKCVYPSPAVTTCKILIEGETQVSCKKCKSDTHPIVAYRGGSLRNISYASDVMSDDEEEEDRVPFSPVSPAWEPSGEWLDVAAWAEKCRIRDRRIVNRALDHYNKTNGTKFVILDDYSIDWYSFSGTWIHMSFKAIDASVVKLFFAEIKYNKVSEPAVTICKILEGETKVGCEYCPMKPSIIHPVVGYRGDLLVKMEIVEKEDPYYKVYCEEFLGEAYVG